MPSNQVHDKFKVFSGELAPDNTIGKLAAEVAAFVVDSNVAAKSIGVEYLESVERLVITLGYRADGQHYPIELICVPLGKVDSLSSDLSALEISMATASANYQNIICHELYVTKAGDFVMILMTHKG